MDIYDNRLALVHVVACPNRRQVIILANADQEARRIWASFGHNEFMYFIIRNEFVVISFTYWVHY